MGVDIHKSETPYTLEGDAVRLRRRLLWQLGNLTNWKGALDLDFSPDAAALKSMTEVERILAERKVMGVSTGPHILSFYRAWLVDESILGSEQLAERDQGQRIRVAGLLVVHQAPPTAKGFHFLTLEDERGLINVIVRPQIYERFSRVVRTA